MICYCATDREALALYTGIATALVIPAGGVLRPKSFAVGETMAIQEAWAPVIHDGRGLIVAAGASTFIYRADGKPLPGLGPDGRLSSARWRSAYCMSPRAVRTRRTIRHSLMVRLHELNRAELFHLGIRIPVNDSTLRPLIRLTGKFPPTDYLPDGPSSKWTTVDFARAELASAWDADHFKEAPWKSNPLVHYVGLEA